MIRRGTLLVIGWLLLVMTAVAPADESDRGEPKKTRHADASGLFSLELPTAWEVTRLSSPATDTARLILKVRLPGQKELIQFRLHAVRGMAAPMAQAHLELRKVRAVGKEKILAGRVEKNPFPHVIFEWLGKAATHRTLLIYRALTGIGYALEIVAPRTLAPLVVGAGFEALTSLQSGLPPWPPEPALYVRSVRNGYVYLTHPDVTEKQVAQYHKFLRRAEKEFIGLHGAFPSPSNFPASIVFHASREAAAALDEEATDDRMGHFHKRTQRRVFAVPLDVHDEGTRARARAALWRLFFWLRFGSDEPAWMFEGERTLQHEVARAGRGLPAVTEWLLDQASPPDPFDARPLGKREDREPYMRRNALYVALFQTGPAKYRKAYKLFLRALDEGEDWDAAAAEHLLSLDEARMQKDAAKLLSKMDKATKR